MGFFKISSSKLKGNRVRTCLIIIKKKKKLSIELQKIYAIHLNNYIETWQS